MTQAQRNTNNGDSQAKQFTDQEKRWLKKISAMTRLITFILLCFTIGWFPYTLGLMLFTVCPQCGVTGQHLVLLTFPITLNSVVNVIVLAVKSKEFKVAFMKIFNFRTSQIAAIEASTVVTMIRWQPLIIDK